jgi:hypothetical protein
VRLPLVHSSTATNQDPVGEPFALAPEAARPAIAQAAVPAYSADSSCQARYQDRTAAEVPEAIEGPEAAEALEAVGIGVVVPEQDRFASATRRQSLSPARQD